VAVAVRQSVDPSYLLQARQWQPQGWSVARQAVLAQIPVNPDGSYGVSVQVDAFEWVDVQGLGLGGTDGGVAQLRQQIQQRGSDLYAYVLLKRQVLNVNVFGVQVAQAWSYRLVLIHSAVELLGWAVLVLAIAFAAVIFLQYVTSGRSPALQDLQGLFQNLFKSAGQAVGAAAGGAATPFVWLFLAAGAASIAFGLAGKQAGVKARPPAASVGVHAGPVSTRVSS
jgi:hypothetical protein